MEPKKEEKVDETTPKEETTTTEETTTGEKVKHVQQLLERQKLEEESKLVSVQRQFWDTQPSMKLEEEYTKNGPLDVPKTPADIKQDPYNLPTGFEWITMDLSNDEEIQRIYTLLAENYVEDDDNMFRFDYSVPFLRWALMPPGYLQQWHLGVIASKSKKLVGFISAIPAKIQVYSSKVKMVEINFLCVHKKLRTHRLAPVLIKEITRRVNLTDVWQAVYTAGSIITKPVGKARYYHRSLNPKKLIEVGFSRLQPKMTMARTIKLYKLPEETQLEGLRPMAKKDISRVSKLLKTYLKGCNLYTHYSDDEIAHFLMPRDDVIQTYVLEKNGEINDFFSFYSLPFSVLNNPKYSHLRAAYSYYNVANTVPLTELMKDALIVARKQGYDVFNALDLMENPVFFQELKFGAGDGDLQYYLYNWSCSTVTSDKIGIVLV